MKMKINKLGPVLGMALEPTPTGWKLTVTHRVLPGGICPQVTELSKLDAVLAYIHSVVSECGVER